MIWADKAIIQIITYQLKLQFTIQVHYQYRFTSVQKFLHLIFRVLINSWKPGFKMFCRRLDRKFAYSHGTWNVEGPKLKHGRTSAVRPENTACRHLSANRRHSTPGRIKVKLRWLYPCIYPSLTRLLSLC